jgi:ankyrin repeat protein
MLIEYGAEVDAKGNNGMTALSWACANNHLEACKLLIMEGAELETKGQYGKSSCKWFSSVLS